MISILARRTNKSETFMGTVVFRNPVAECYPVTFSTKDDVAGNGGRGEKVRFGTTMEYPYGVEGTNFKKVLPSCQLDR